MSAQKHKEVRTHFLSVGSVIVIAFSLCSRLPEVHLEDVNNTEIRLNCGMPLTSRVMAASMSRLALAEH